MFVKFNDHINSYDKVSDGSYGMLIYPGLDILVNIELFSSSTHIYLRKDSTNSFSIRFTGTKSIERATKFMEYIDLCLQFSPAKNPEMFL